MHGQRRGWSEGTGRSKKMRDERVIMGQIWDHECSESGRYKKVKHTFRLGGCKRGEEVQIS